jgi:general secretion pathway protein H
VLKHPHKQVGFTLIEVMLVLVLIGLIASGVRFNLFGQSPEQSLEKASLRFSGVVQIAAEYGMLNNVEIGLIVDEEGYQFVAFDGEDWQTLDDQKALVQHTLPEIIDVELTFDDLPIEQNDFFENGSLFDDTDDIESEGIDTEEKPLIPQAVFFSGGDITPFMLTFSLSEDIDVAESIEYQVLASYTLPLKITGPIYDGVIPDER